jgi:hypothetical protein
MRYGTRLPSCNKYGDAKKIASYARSQKCFTWSYTEFNLVGISKIPLQKTFLSSFLVLISVYLLTVGVEVTDALDHTQTHTHSTRLL